MNKHERALPSLHGNNVKSLHRHSLLRPPIRVISKTSRNSGSGTRPACAPRSKGLRADEKKAPGGFHLPALLTCLTN
ncbi:MAG TPA: hypothetical protein VFX07_01615 [Candidatus Udaeobacter sp.]|nr:hypothetical protein [Candidatus Udaeobacter sp.]